MKPIHKFDTSAYKNVFVTIDDNGILTVTGEINDGLTDHEIATIDLLREIYTRFRDQKITTAQIIDRASIHKPTHDAVHRFMKTKRTFTAATLGLKLRSIVDQPIGGYVLRQRKYAGQGQSKWMVKTV